ncbi:septum formation initiator family protein [Candidatus Marinimicrobia bacterium]|jgi:cell division protein FtsB|nr:septum formation initiator family protein [Candidatus Neomarinimicrobiota bacterium]MDB3883568.1 septum formation initiator family protein [Candidatus Neomarinimicrobiota bacterium]MDC0654132.1 septum formation initiator family protein [Candidatus Neomarinimicrobiota bacterium]MDC1000412.1 septum formation initiator family protein [Candidatus Neomarinimicrobiota bacterium]MDC1145489.1 septum formation initiator family protein [Candidatus Neomarinimicrobiota bacterium]|tara:strand:- start:2366 stop:2647 length:282 start_codon:yes stop_codon:yes gene_type:complete
MNFKSLSLTNILFGCLSLGCILLLLFSDRGFITLWNLKKEKIEIQEDINSLRQQIASLEKEAEKLEFDEKYIEKIAREKFRMSKPGEKVFKVE